MLKWKKKLTNEENNTILNNLKDENEYFDLVLDENEVKQIIIDKFIIEEEEIKEIIKQKYKEEKQKKINDLLNKFEQETNFSKYLDYAKVAEKILSYKLKENEIKEWIKSKNPDNKMQAIIVN